MLHQLLQLRIWQGHQHEHFASNSVTLYLRLSDAEMMSCLMNELSLDVNSISSSISRVDLCVLLSAARYRCLSVCAWCFVVLKATGSADIGQQGDTLSLCLQQQHRCITDALHIRYHCRAALLLSTSPGSFLYTKLTPNTDVFYVIIIWDYTWHRTA